MERLSVLSEFPFSIAVAFLLGFGARQIGLPPLVGFLVAGFVLSAFGIVVDDTIERIGDLGVTLLLFTIGLKLKLKNLARPEVWGTASLHAMLTTMLFGASCFALSVVGFSIFAQLDLATSILVGFALSFSSTVFAVKDLEQKGEVSALHGRTAIGILIVQDIFAVVFLTLSTGKLPSPWAFALVGLILLRPAFDYMMSRVGHGELLALFGMFSALAIGVSAFELVGMKADLGALLIGMLMAHNKRAAEVADALFEFKEIFLVGFFLTIGLKSSLGLVEVGIGALLLILIPVKAALFFFLLTRFRLRARSSLLTSLSLSNYSEFGLIVAAVGAKVGWISETWLLVIAIALSFSFIAIAPLSAQAHGLYSLIRKHLDRFETKKRHPEEQPVRTGDARIVIFGMGRVGTGAYDHAHANHGDVILGIDSNAEKVAAHKDAGRNVLLGDATDPAFWERVERGDVRAVLLAMPEHSANLAALEECVLAGTEVYVAALAQHPDQARVLEEAGATIAFNMYREAGAGFVAELESKLDNLCEDR